MRIEVVESSVAGAGQSIEGMSYEIDAAAGRIRDAVTPACGFTDAGGALETFSSNWYGAMSRSSVGISGLGAVLSITALLYGHTDEVSMPSAP
jgi:hypothetical protein